MKTVPSLFLPVALFFALFIGCSDSGGGGSNISGEGGSNISGEGGSNSSDEGGTPDVNINVSACGSDVDGLLQCAVESLKKEKWDEAVAYYDAAYDKDNASTKAIIYSVLANLAKISTDPKMQSLMKEHFGFTTYPNRLNALLSDSWMKEYKDEYNNVSLPVIKTPSWVTGSGSIYNNALLSGNVLSADNFAISLIANIIDKNSNGFNSLLDDVIDGVFGSSYNLALDRLKKLENKTEDRIKLNPYFIEQLGLEDVFDEYDQIGWAEVNVILSATLLVKASLEWVQSYDLSTDLNWLKYAWKDDSDDIRNHFNTVSVSKLPFKNNFLNSRPGKMAKSKEDYVKAIKGFQDSYTSIKNSELYPSKVKESYATINEGFGKLISAINNGGKFYIPEDPTKGTWPTSKTNSVEATIDLGKFFTEGYFSLRNIFETTSDGSPVFYSRNEVCDNDVWWWQCDYVYDELNKNNYAELMRDGRLALAIKTATFKAIIDEPDDGKLEYLKTGLSGKDAKAVFEKYYP